VPATQLHHALPCPRTPAWTCLVRRAVCLLRRARAARRMLPYYTHAWHDALPLHVTPAAPCYGVAFCLPGLWLRDAVRFVVAAWLWFSWEGSGLRRQPWRRWWEGGGGKNTTFSTSSAVGILLDSSFPSPSTPSAGRFSAWHPWAVRAGYLWKVLLVAPYYLFSAFATGDLPAHLVLFFHLEGTSLFRFTAGICGSGRTSVPG